MHVNLIKPLLLSGVTMISLTLTAQVIDPTTTFKTIHQQKYFRLHYDNDYFTKTDYYYSQGITLEYLNPAFKKIPVSKLFIIPKKSATQYGISANIFGYTPTSIESNTILYGDRPFSSCMTVDFFAMASDSVKRRRVSSTVTLGIIGPAAQGEEIQAGIHSRTGNVMPLGWQYQIQNDVIVNYRLDYEKNLLMAGKAFIVNGTAGADLGTLTDRVNAGINVMAGHCNNPFETVSKSRNKIEYYFYGQARMHVIGYNATLQGGLFNHASPYTIPDGDIARLNFQADAGIVFNFRNLFLSYTQSYLTREFSTGRYHRWGGISVGCSF